MKNKTRLVG